MANLHLQLNQQHQCVSLAGSSEYQHRLQKFQSEQYVTISLTWNMLPLYIWDFQFGSFVVFDVVDESVLPENAQSSSLPPFICILIVGYGFLVSYLQDSDWYVWYFLPHWLSILLACLLAGCGLSIKSPAWGLLVWDKILTFQENTAAGIECHTCALPSWEAKE